MPFTHAITRQPGPSMVDGISTAKLGSPDYQLALKQHAAYVDALKACGLHVTVLPPYDDFADSTFVEDTALCTSQCAIITRPGAMSRRGETASIEPAVREFYDKVEHVQTPGTADAGDIMMVGDHFYIGLSARTNQAGARQIIEILRSYGLDGSTVPLRDVLHLKTGVSYLENNVLLASGEFLSAPEFREFEIIPVSPDESYAANSLWVNGTVLVPQGHSKTEAAIKARGYATIAADLSEFRKLDGGLSCLSLRF